MKGINTIVIVLGIILILGLIFVSSNLHLPRACTEEAKRCQDGSYVGRDPYNNCEFRPCPSGTTSTTITSVTPQQDLATLHAVVIDKITGEPVEDAIVYLGYHPPETWRCHTINDGKCSIEDKNLVWGDYGLSVFKKGYNRFTNSSHFEKGDNYLTIKLEKKSVIPTTISINGTVIESITAKGTMSENHYYKIKDDGGKEEYIFNEIGENQDFDNYVNQTVRITGFRENGFIGWQHEEVEGIYVEGIEII